MRIWHGADAEVEYVCAVSTRAAFLLVLRRISRSCSSSRVIDALIVEQMASVFACPQTSFFGQASEPGLVEKDERNDARADQCGRECDNDDGQIAGDPEILDESEGADSNPAERKHRYYDHHSRLRETPWALNQWMHSHIVAEPNQLHQRSILQSRRVCSKSPTLVERAVQQAVGGGLLQARPPSHQHAIESVSAFDLEGAS